MKIPYYQIDAFAGSVFSGNPAGVCLLDEWLEDDILQSIAAENNLSETAFLVEEGAEYGLRWFCPEMEVDLCGHATLASAFVLFEYVDSSKDRISFNSQSGLLTVARSDDLLAMDFPARRPKACQTPELLAKALGSDPAETHFSIRDCMAVFDTEEQVHKLRPDMRMLCKLDSLGIIVTAPGTRSDFVSRFFAPRAGVPEDPVTGSAHSTLVPYWAERLKKSTLHALQVSKRGGELYCEDHGDRVQIAGKAAMYLQGTIVI
jgi:PhzF family phenazine biosynthesis protein